jgi:hypothetical protein
MSGGKGGSSTSQVTIPEYIEAAAQRNLNKAERISQLGYVPEYGPTVAAFTPMQQAGFQNTANLASQYGIGAPASQQDIMGGMGAPTTYANGVRGYSSAPLYDQMVAELAAKRPGQKSYIDSFFIDPKSGSYARQPFDYTQYNTMAENARQQSVLDRLADTGHPVLVAGRDFNNRTTSMNTPLSYLPGGVNDPFLTSAPSQAIARASTPSGMTRNDDNSYSRSGSAAPATSIRPVARPAPKEDLPGNVVTRALNIGAGKKDSSSSSGYAGEKDDGTVMCTAYCEMGYLPKAIWALDRRYGVKMYREDPTLIEGYHMWGVPVANYLRKQTFGAKVLRAVMWPIVKAWAEEMAHNMKPEEYAPNYFGKLIKFVGEPFSRLCGKLKPRSIEGAV